MKKSQLQQIIKEELQNVLKEYSSNSFNLDASTQGYGSPINPSLLSKLLPKSAQTSKEAEERLRTFEGGQMSMHSQVFYGKPNGNRPDRPTFYFGQSQYYLRDNDVNVTMLLIKDVTGGQDKKLGWAFVNTDVFLNEFKSMYEEVTIPTSENTVTENTFKVGDIVVPNQGPHKGVSHKVIYANPDGTYNISPILPKGSKNMYRLGAAKANASQLQSTVSEGVSNEQMDQIVADVFNGMGLEVVGVDSNISGAISAPSSIVTFKKAFDSANKMRFVDDYNDNRDMSTPEMIGADVLAANKVRFYFKSK